ncbi:MAG: carbamoyltransferase HypF [Anaerolineae bacterium]|nr:carbamoyltransferase HypF [Anaerolineae bacterium]
MNGRKQITVSGVVQGVGFRPFVFNLAEKLGLYGWVLNHSGGVDIEIEGQADTLDQFAIALREQAPPLARIESVDIRDAPLAGYKTFEIRHSVVQSGRYQLVSPDMATCADCLRELLDENDRRHRYPFTNCTNCGPRFTIIADIPYDRPNTTMGKFVMCPDCQREYDDPHDRRFHAQPNACPVCGPRLELITDRKPQIAEDTPWNDLDVVAQAAQLLKTGYILAIKGLGGFHLACDATNARAIRTLRERKRRLHKPFALMMSTLEQARRHCRISMQEAALLDSPQSPIVLLPWLVGSDIATEVAPGQNYLGVMLPYTPLHHILLRESECPLVMTSGNLSEEPIAADNDEALDRLRGLADAFVLHNRDIYARYDDSVFFVCQTGNRSIVQPIRRARGYAPFPIKFPFKCTQILATGAEIKNSFCLTRDEYAFVSQHIGDMENLETMQHLEQTVVLYERLFRIEPAVIAYDMHPAYLSTRYAKEQAAQRAIPTVAVQHHHAHLAACLADNGWAADDGPVIGVIMDGTGYGEDNQIWGGEWLVGEYSGYHRAAHLEYLPLPGGDAATRHPWRIAFSYLYTLLGNVTLPFAPSGIGKAQISLLQQQIDRSINCPQTSSTGRLFDAVSALLGICSQTSYEAQAAIELEMAADPVESKSAYPFDVELVDDKHVVRLQALFAALIDEIANQVPNQHIAWRFHQTIAWMIVEVSERIAAQTGLHTVALSGGCFQNRLLLTLVLPALEDAGFKVLLHHQVPCNDGGLSLGQAAIAQFHRDNQQQYTTM